MKSLLPLTLKDIYYTQIEAEIRRVFDQIMYEPLVYILQMRMRDIKSQIKNSRSALINAITEGHIWYEDGEFKGKFNARTSRAIIQLGGSFNVKSGTYSLPKKHVPSEVMIAQAQATSRYELLRAQMLSAIDNMDADVVNKISKANDEYKKSINRMDADFQRNFDSQADDISKRIAWAYDSNPASAKKHIIVEAKLTPEQKTILARDWGQNLDLYIKEWTQENILKLREDIQPHVMAGGRAEGLIKVIEDNYGIATRKAKFLARQETALLMSKFQQTRYEDIGIMRYRWSTAHDRRVRHDHHELNGKIFSFDSPPVTNKKTGARNNPGEDYNCRCVAIPLVE